MCVRQRDSTSRGNRPRGAIGALPDAPDDALGRWPRSLRSCGRPCIVPPHGQARQAHEGQAPDVCPAVEAWVGLGPQDFKNSGDWPSVYQQGPAAAPQSELSTEGAP